MRHTPPLLLSWAQLSTVGHKSSLAPTWRAGPKRKKRKLRYTPHVVAYIDILGFRELVHEKSPGAISRAIRHVRDITVPDADKLKFDRENYVNFSDLIVHTVPVHSKSNQEKPRGIVSHEIRYTAMVQAVLIEKDILLRGAITIGEIERSYGVLFGPGLIAAYELERDQAVYPRIVVDHAPSHYRILEKLVHPNLLSGRSLTSLNALLR